MTLEERVINMRMNEFGLSKVHYIGQPEKDVFPRKINVVKWETCEPTKVYSLDKNKYVYQTSYCYVIGQLEWDSGEDWWQFSSIGTRYLEDSTKELNDWLVDFCNKYIVNEAGELEEVYERI